MVIRHLPRPRSFDEVAAAIAGLIERIDRVVEGQLQVSQQIGQLMGEIAAMRKHMTDRPPPLPPMRDRMRSTHDYDEYIRELEAVIDKQVKDPATKHDSEWAKRITQEAIQLARKDWKARVFDAVVKDSWKVVLSVVVAYLVFRLGLGKP